MKSLDRGHQSGRCLISRRRWARGTDAAGDGDSSAATHVSQFKRAGGHREDFCQSPAMSFWIRRTCYKFRAGASNGLQVVYLHAAVAGYKRIAFIPRFACNRIPDATQMRGCGIQRPQNTSSQHKVGQH